MSDEDNYALAFVNIFMKNKFIHIILDNLKTLIGALIIALIIRSFILQPFYIPSSSMERLTCWGQNICYKIFLWV